MGDFRGMKKIIALIVTLAMVFVLYGCGNTLSSEEKEEIDKALAGNWYYTEMLNWGGVGVYYSFNDGKATFGVFSISYDFSTDGIQLEGTYRIEKETIEIKLDDKDIAKYELDSKFCSLPYEYKDGTITIWNNEKTQQLKRTSG